MVTGVVSFLSTVIFDLWAGDNAVNQSFHIVWDAVTWAPLSVIMGPKSMLFLIPVTRLAIPMDAWRAACCTIMLVSARFSIISSIYSEPYSAAMLQAAALIRLSVEVSAYVSIFLFSGVVLIAFLMLCAWRRMYSMSFGLYGGVSLVEITFWHSGPLQLALGIGGIGTSGGSSRFWAVVNASV